MNAEEKSRYFQELTLNLRHKGLTIKQETKDGLLPVELDSQRLCQVTDNGGIRYWREDVADDVRSTILDRVNDIARVTAEYMSQLESAPRLTASSLEGDYRLLTDFNDVVLAGHPTQYGVQFVTWERSPDQTSLEHGHYYGPNAGADSYTAAKQDFAVRSGLIPKNALFTPEQSMEIYHCCTEMPWLLFFTGIFFTEIYWWGCNQSFVQRVLGAKSLKDAQQGTIICSVLKGIGFLYLALPGVIACFLPSIQSKIAAAGDSAIDFAYPALITAVIPKPLMGFFAAVLFGAILSSFNSVLNSAATMFSLDLYKTIKPDAPDEKVVKIGRYYGVFAGIISVAVAPFVMYASGITTLLNTLVQFVCLPVLFAVLCAMVFRRAPKYTPILITVLHVVTYAAFLVIQPTYPTNGDPVHYLYFIFIQFVVELIIVWVLDRFFETPEAWTPPKSLSATEIDMTPWKYRYVGCGVAIALLVFAYVLFSPIVLPI